MGQKCRKIECVYDRVAKEYADNFFGEHDKKPRDREILRRFSRKIGERRPVVDLACGPGQTTRFLKDLGVDISGLDLSEKLLAQARKRNPDIHFYRGNLLDLGFEDDSIAAAVAFYAIVHFTRKQVAKAFREVYRVLQPGGLFLCAWHLGDRTMRLEEFLDRKVDIDFMFFPTEFIRGCLHTYGFKSVEITERDPYPGVEYQSRRAYALAEKG